MTAPSRPRCPNCNAPNAATQGFCGSCGQALTATPSLPVSAPPRVGVLDRPIHRLLKGALGLWAVGYLVLSCSPIWAPDEDGGTIMESMLVGLALFGPWIVGVIILGILVWITK